MSATSDIQSKPGHAEILIAEDSPTQAEKLRYLLEEAWLFRHRRVKWQAGPRRSSPTQAHPDRE